MVQCSQTHFNFVIQHHKMSVVLFLGNLIQYSQYINIFDVRICILSRLDVSVMFKYLLDITEID